MLFICKYISKITFKTYFEDHFRGMGQKWI